MQVVILAGGVASRMKPLAERLPKSLFPVVGRPFLDWQLELVARGGATRVLLVVSHLSEAIAAHLEATKPPLPVTLISDGAQRAGTGGALTVAVREGLVEESFLVTYGDSYLPVDLVALSTAHIASGLPATMAVHENHDRWDASNVVVERERVVRYEKILEATKRPPAMRWIDFGLLALQRDEVLRWSDEAPFDLGAPLGRLANAGQLGAFGYAERFYEVGSPSGLAELERLLSASHKATA
jgi:NDP-sugar pyrophosphorylase family protein